MRRPKHVRIVLRCVMEMLVGNACLSLQYDNPDELYTNTGFRWPPFSASRKSMLQHLLVAGAIDEGQLWLLRTVYGKLSKSVHCQPGHLNADAREVGEESLFYLADLLVGFGESVFPVVKRCLVR